MKEYEYIIAALEGYLCDQLAGVICSENYRDRSYNAGYMTIFKEYWSLHEKYKNNCAQLEDPTQEKKVQDDLQVYCQKQREEICKCFLNDMQACVDDPNFDLTKSKDSYLEKLRAEDANILAKRVCLYPYLVSVMREHCKREGESDGLEV